MRNINPLPIIGFMVIALAITIGAVMFPQAMYAADYVVDNGTASNSTNTTMSVGLVEQAWFWGLGVLIAILVIGTILWKFFVR